MGGASLGLKRFFEIGYLPANTYQIQGRGSKKNTL